MIKPQTIQAVLTLDISSGLLLGFRARKTDSSLFIYACSALKILLIVYVDDIIVCSSNPPHFRLLFDSSSLSLQ